MTRCGCWVLCALLAVGVLPAVAQPTPPQPLREGLRLRLTNAEGGAIEASEDGGRTWLVLGHVTHPALKVNPNSYTAAGWAQDSAIAATAANAIHIRLGTNPDTKRPMTLSVVPGGKTVGAANRQPSATVCTDIEGGTSIFGGGLGPFVNSPVLLASTNPPAPLPPTYEPRVGDVWLIVRYEPARLPLWATFENRPGGAVEVGWREGTQQVGVVDRAVSGIGRFEGGLYAAAGRIRANHPGVIDVSTSPLGLMGGFQIIPRHHAQSPEMSYVSAGHQWLVVGPPAPGDPDWAGQPPFFSGTILPSYRPDDILGEHVDWMRRVLSRSSFEVRYNDGPWEPMPRIAFGPLARPDTERQAQRGRRGLWLIPTELNPNKAQPREAAAVADHALDGITHFRLVFPQADFWPTDQ